MSRVIVIGAGPSGLTAALAIRRAGHEALVFERGSDLANVQVGGGMHLWNNAMRALQELGAAEQVEAAGDTVTRFEWYTRQGDSIGVGDVGELTERLGAPAVGLTRKELHGALLDAVDRSTLTLGADLTSFEQDAEGVTARFADGREERGDALVGADGLHSAVRRQLLGETAPRYSGIVVCQAAVRSSEQFAPASTYGMILGRGVRLGFYPIREGTFWYLLVRAPQGGFARAGACKEPVLRTLRGWWGRARAMVEATPEADIVRGDIVGREPVETWGEGRVTLLGDAAHAMTPFLGQGASQGIEDSVVLGRCLGDNGDIVSALRRYEDLRKPRTAEITREAWKLGKRTKMSNPVATVIRDRIIGRIFDRVVWGGVERVVAGHELGERPVQTAPR